MLACLVSALPGLDSTAFASGEEVSIQKEEPHTTYTRRWNWCHARDPYYSTTRHSSAEEPRLDESRDPDQNPPHLYMGSATATFNDLPPGKYSVRVFYRKSTNRSRAVPWEVTTDGEGNNHMSGIVDQYEEVGCCGEWYDLDETWETPLDVTSTLTLVWSRDSGDFPEYDARSVSYGGVRAVRVEDGPTEKVSTPSISPNGGAFEGQVAVTLTAATAGAEIRYTIDGADPGGNSALYVTPFLLTQSATVKARAFREGMLASDLASADFTILPKAADAGSARDDAGSGGRDAPAAADGMPARDGAHDVGDEGPALSKDGGVTAASGSSGCGCRTMRPSIPGALMMLFFLAAARKRKKLP